LAKVITSFRQLACSVFACSLLSTLSVLAQQADGLPTSLRDEIKYYNNSDVANQIPYFDNRFAIDANIDEITLLFYRRKGTPPIILVRPDGSKLKIGQLPKDKVTWFDDRTFDTVKIKKPMPGPWQAIGSIEKDSKIMVVSEVHIKVEPLPEVLLAGETLKVTGQLFNGEHAIESPAFREVVRLDVDFFSTNNTAYDNFGAKPIQLTSFRDDGYNLDEYAGDSIFTGEFTLSFAPGEWVPSYYVKLPMAQRELKQQAVIIRHNPITPIVKVSEIVDKAHTLELTIDDEFVDPDSLIFQGKIVYPDKQELPFSIMEGEGVKREFAIENTEPGIFRVKIGAFGKTVNGREFRLVVPEYTFNVEGQEIEESILDVNGTLESTLSKISAEEALALQLVEEKAQQEAEDKATYIAIGIANGVIIVLFGLGFGLYRWGASKKKQ